MKSFKLTYYLLVCFLSTTLFMSNANSRLIPLNNTLYLQKAAKEIANFLIGYDKYCIQNFNSSVTSDPTLLCPCLSPGLIGRINISRMLEPELGNIEIELHDSPSGGTWYPLTCVARHKVAVIVPFRDREKHLKWFLKVVHLMLRRQLLHYTIFVVEQSYPKVFNKASLMNAGFKEAAAMDSYDCFVFHDVDMLPEDDRNFYTCSKTPRHVGSFVNKWNYNLPYEGLIGGVTAFQKSHFELLNGFSNSFYGWGGEDDDMFKRILAKNVPITRFPKVIAKYTMIKHHSDDGNPPNSKGYEGFSYRPNSYKTDGLNSLRYKVDKIDVRPLYIWLHISLPSNPSYLVTENSIS